MIISSDKKSVIIIDGFIIWKINAQWNTTIPVFRGAPTQRARAPA